MEKERKGGQERIDVTWALTCSLVYIGMIKLKYFLYAL